MKTINKIDKIIAVLFAVGFCSVVLSVVTAFVSTDAAQVMFFGGGSVALLCLIYTMIKGVYSEDLP